MAIGEMILDFFAAAPRLSGEAAQAAAAAEGGALNGLFALGAGPRRALRAQLSALLAAGSEAAGRLALHPAGDCVMRLPAVVGDYTDFYVGIHHATRLGRLFRPDNPLLPNYKHIPIGYHGRASSIVPSGAPVIRPFGQQKLPEAAAPRATCRRGNPSRSGRSWRRASPPRSAPPGLLLRVMNRAPVAPTLRTGEPTPPRKINV